MRRGILKNRKEGAILVEIYYKKKRNVWLVMVIMDTREIRKENIWLKIIGLVNQPGR